MTLRRSAIWAFAGNSIYAACQWGILIVLAQLGGPEVVGRFSLALAITAPVMIFSNLALRQVQVTDATGLYSFSDYLGVRVITTLLGLLMIGIISKAGGYYGEVVSIIIAVGIAKAFESLSDIFYGLQQRHERLDRVAFSLILRGSIGLLGLTVIYYMTRSLLLGIYAMVTVWAMVLLLYDVPISRQWLQRVDISVITELKKHFCSIVWLRLVWLALPLGLSTMLLSLNTNIPRYFIERYLGEEALGVFAAMVYLMVAGNMVIVAIGQAASPRLASYYTTQQFKKFYRLLSKLLLVSLFLGLFGIVAVIFFGREILVIFYGLKFSSNLDILAWIMLAATLHYLGSSLGYAITATRHFHRFLLPYSGISLVAVITSAMLIPSYKLLGAAWVTGLVGLTTCVVPLFLFYQLRREKQ